MCLIFDQEINDATQKRLEAEGEIIAYKVVDFFNGKYQSPMFCYAWHEGWNYRGDGSLYGGQRGYPLFIPADTDINYIRKNKYYNLGIHVFLRKEDAESFLIEVSGSCTTIIEVECHKEDFLAAGKWDDERNEEQSATFTKVFVKELPKQPLQPQIPQIQ